MTRTVSAFQSPSNNVATETYPITSGNIAAGDLVYYNKDGTYGPIPTSSIAGINPTTTAGANLAFGNGAPGGNRQGIANIYGGSIGKNVAFCTGGALALPTHFIAYMDRQLGQPYFVIYDQTAPVGNPVVNTTSLSATFINTVNANICAATLSDNNVVVVWANSAGGTANTVNYAIVNPITGAVVVAATQDTGATVVGAVPIRVVALAGGGFVVAVPVAGNIISFRGYNNSGVAQFAWTNMTNVNVSTSLMFGIAANSTTFLIAAPSTTSNNVAYVAYTHAGVLSSTANTFVSQIGTTTMGSVDVGVVPSSEEYFIGYLAQGAASTYYPAYRRLTLSTLTLTAEYYVPVTSTNMLNAGTTGATSLGVIVYPLPAPYTTVLMGFVGSTSIAASYVVFDTTNNTAVSGTYGAVGTTAPFNTAAVAHTNQSAYTPVGTGAFAFFISPFGSALDKIVWYTNTGTTSPLIRGMNFAKIDVASGSGPSYTMQQSSYGTFTYSTPNVFGTATAYSDTNSTPTQASFALANTAAYYTPVVGSVVATPTVIDQLQVSGLATCTLADGKYVVAYVRANGAIVVNVYYLANLQNGGAAVLYGTYTTITDLSNFTSPATYLNQCIKIAPIANSNNIVVAYTTSTTNVRVVLIDSASGSLVGSTANITVTAMTMAAGSTTFDVAPLAVNANGQSRYVIAYNSSTGSRLAYQVRDGSTNASIVAETLVSAGATTTAAVGAFATGGFLVACRDTTATTSQIYTYGNPTGNTFTQVLGATNLSAFAAETDNRFVASTSNGYVIVSDVAAATTARGYIYAINGAVQNYSLTLATPTAHFAVGFSGADAPIIFGHDSTTFAASQYSATLVGSIKGATTTLASSFTNTANVNTLPAIAPGFGSNYIVVYRNAAYQPVLAYATGAGISDFASLSGAVSNGIPIYANSATATSPAITNTVLVGVALNNANSGSDAVVQVSGQASLNTNYPASPTTRAFDYTKQAVRGVRGTITGRTLNLSRDV